MNATNAVAEYYENLDRLLNDSVVTIGEVNGRAWGAGDEHLQRMDMRFAGPDAEFGASEAAVGLVHVGGLQQLTRLIGPGWTAEYMLSAAQIDAEEATRMGRMNSALPSSVALRAHVNQLAARIAFFHIEVLRATKASIVEQAPSSRMLVDDLARFNALTALLFAAQNIKNIVTKSGNQSEWCELNNNDNVVKALF